MLAFGAIVLSIFLAYRVMSVGLLPVLSRCVIGAVAIALGGGLAGGLRAAIPMKGDYLQGVLFIFISLGAYLFLRGVIMYYMLERDIPIPSLVDRFGAAIFGYFGGLMLCGYVAIVIIVLPLPATAGFKEQLKRPAQYGIAPVKLAACVASTEEDTGMTVTLENVLYKTPTRAGETSPKRPVKTIPKTAPAAAEPQE